MKAFEYFLISTLLLATHLVFAQGHQTNNSNPSDSLFKYPKNYLDFLKSNNKMISAENFTVIQQNKILKELKGRTDIGKSILREGFDSLLIQNELQGSEEWNNLASNGVFDTDVKFLMTSNLSVSKIILRELLTRTEKALNNLISYREKFEKVQFDIDSLISLDVLYQASKDTSEALDYLKRMMKTQGEAAAVRNQINKTLNEIQDLESSASELKFDLESKYLKIEHLHTQRIYTYAERDFDNFKYLGNSKSLMEIINYSGTKIFLAIIFYLENNIGLMILLIIVVIGVILYLKIMKRHLTLIQKDEVSEYYVLKHPVLTSVIVTTSVYQFLLGNPPFALYQVLWLISVVFLFFLLKYSVDVNWQKWFVALGILYLFVFLDNLILLTHIIDKIFVIVISISGIGLGILGLFNLKKSDAKVVFLKWFLVFFIILESLALIINVLGYQNISKRLMVAGYMGLILIIILGWTVTILYRVFRLSLEVYKKSDNYRLTINSEHLNKNVPKSLFAAALAGWAYMLIQYIYLLQIIINPVVEFFTEERRIGDFVFTLDHILLFIAIIFISTLLSKILSYLLADSFVIKERVKTKKGPELGSWVLLLRIGITSLGIIIAFVSAGFAFDRITIIISALSVGIGFGMQTLINNLVSGIIIAFEKPINVGDVVEVAGKTGRMKSIGFRSSMVTTWDGSDVIIPNGDLLNQHLTNWTLGNSHARFEIVVGVAYGTDLEAVHQLVMDLLNSNKEVLSYPQPLVVFHEFGSSSIDMSIKFWVADYSTGIIVKSDLIIALDKLFKEKNIVIPFPQHDVHVKSVNNKTE